MSLHIGNLPSQTRPDDLERVFRRFGRCTIKVKDKYGFVVYDYPASAERALNTLKGTRICGQALNLSWSKQQPTAPKRFSIGDRKFYEPPRKRYTVGDNAERRPVPHSQHVDSKNSNGEIRKSVDSPVFVGDLNSTIPFDLNPCVEMRDLKNLPQDDRWGFDRYEPHSDGKELDGRRQESPPAFSPSVETDQLFEMKSQCDKEPTTSKNRKRSTGHGESSKKRNKRDYSNGERDLSPSSFHSDYASSRSRSLFESSSPSMSKSVPLEKVSGPYSLKSSPSYHSGAKTFDTRSRSRDRSTLKSHNSSLLPLETDSTDYVENGVGTVCSKDLKISENIKSAAENELETRPATLGQGEDTEKDILETDDEDFGGEHISAVEADISIRSKMSSEEMCMVLKYCGLQCPDENEMDLPVENFIGSARLWPWEMIYYRRLKKGSISNENYSRRVAQNQEFAIVDKYIRGSSGWGELN